MSSSSDDFFKNKRPWSVTKDELLRCYLLAYFVKIFATRKEVVYVDCFAGRGTFEDGQKGSPLIAFEVYTEACSKSKTPQIVYWKFIEAKRKLYKELNSAVAQIENCETINGRFEDKIVPIIKAVSHKQNVFLYVDPYGTRAMIFDVFAQIAQSTYNSLELLINFNSFGFIRDACSALAVDSDLEEGFFNDLEESDPTEIDHSNNSVSLLNAIANGDYWIDIINRNRKPNGKCNGIAAEKEFMEEYRKQLSSLFRYVLDMPILLKDGGRPVYRMIHLTNHCDGCILMAENMLTRSKVHVLEVQRKGQVDLFSGTDQDLEGNFVNYSEVYAQLEALLSDYDKEMTLSDILADFYTRYGALCKIKPLKDILLEMEKSGHIVITRYENGHKIEKNTMSQKNGIIIKIRRA